MMLVEFINEYNMSAPLKSLGYISPKEYLLKEHNLLYNLSLINKKIVEHKHNIDRMTLKDIPSGIEGRIEDIVVLTQWWQNTASATFDAGIKFREWQAALYLNKKFTALSLTGGILYSDLKGKYWEKTVGYDSGGNVTGTLIYDEP